MKKMRSIRWQLAAYDLVVLLAAEILLQLGSSNYPGLRLWLAEVLVFTICVYGARFAFDVYRQIWRYGGIQCYIRLLTADFTAFLLSLVLWTLLPLGGMNFPLLLGAASVNLLGALGMRMFYRYAFKCGRESSAWGRFLLKLLRIFGGKSVVNTRLLTAEKIKIAIIGAGRLGVSLAEELTANTAAAYNPCCFVDINPDKVGRDIQDIPVIGVNEETLDNLRALEVQEVVFTIPSMEESARKKLFDFYHQAGYAVKVYDFPAVQSAGGRRHLREFDIEELLFRKPIQVLDQKTRDYYRNKTVLITGGGGSIGSELGRQIASMFPLRLIILDIYENCAYDLQQSLLFAFPGLDVRVEIVSITNKLGLDRVFRAYHPDIVIHAAAHKHVPLMEHNIIEAVENNVFGTLNVVRCCEQFGVGRLMMVSTDKAVNPTNVMGATKRLCEMIGQAHSVSGRVQYSATRFGNVLGSAGSVIPLFKRQIAAGGPVTLTDRRIVRYFMTIPEASQLVLVSGAMAKNGELFALDMGQPIKILDLAENMIRLSGVQGVEILETGLRPGEKLYEELLVKTEELDRTENELIFVERDTPITLEELEKKLEILRTAIATGDDEQVRQAIRQVVPTYRTPEEVNTQADDAEEMRSSKTIAHV